VIALPFAGEFGHEVALWSPHLRWLKRVMNYASIEVHCLEGHEGLYRDFANQVHTFPRPAGLRSDCHNAWVHGKLLRPDDLRALTHRRGRKAEWIGFDSMQVVWSPAPTSKRREFRLLGEHLLNWKDSPEVVVHARMCDDKQPERNWPKESWDEFVAAMQPRHVMAIGSLQQAYLPKGAFDCRGIGVGALCDVLHTATCIVGPSSGPMALALQCNCAVVWWSGNPQKDVVRYGSAWNPFGIRTTQVEDSWKPSVQKVSEAVSAMLQPAT
jgi:hypothetical protein